MPLYKANLTGFLSLKWKIMLSLGSVLLVLTALFISFAFQDQMTRFEQERDVVNARHTEQAKILLQDFSLRLSQIASLVATMANTDSTINSVKPRKTTLIKPQKSRMDVAWATLQVDYGLESIRIYNADSRLQEQWSAIPSSTQELQQVKQAIHLESNIDWISCTTYCQQYAVAPILAEGKVAGAIVVSASLAELILDFQGLVDADIGFLIADNAATGSNALPRLGMRVAGLSNASHNNPVLLNLQQIPVDSNRAWIRVSADNQYHEIAFYPVKNTPNGDLQTTIVVIDDVTRPYRAIRQHTEQILQGGAIGSLLLLTLMYLLLNAPLRRTTNTIRAIPLLGLRNFNAVRKQIQIRVNPLIKDEVDKLDEATLELTNHLETLENEASQHQAEIMVMLNRISAAHEFSERILDTAQVVIVTQSADGSINSINRFGAQLLGWNKDDLSGKSLFTAQHHNADSRTQLLNAYQNIVSGSIEQHYHEGQMSCSNGELRDFAWHHSRLNGEQFQVVSIGVDITQHKQNEQKILYLAEHDQLTGLMNRQRFVQEVEAALIKIGRTGRDHTLLYLDLDGFKYVNDISGHQAGDLVLSMVADEISQVIRDIDVFARLGGDEMGILLFECNRDNAIEVAKKINIQLKALRFPGLVGEHHISASIGIVELAGNNRDVKQLLVNADIAMYHAKSLGRARWHVFSEGEGLQEKLQLHIKLEDQIQQALRDKRFTMVYQPILNIQHNRISHYEALVRMIGVDGSMIAPIEFIEVAEKTGQIRELDHYVVRLVIQRWTELLAAGVQHKVAINLSGHSMTDSTLLEMLKSLFKQHPKLPSFIIFEITETAAVADFASAREFIETVRSMGCAFSLDDFGVGFSSFYYVKHLPVDYVKIDGSFIRNLADNTDDQIFVRALTEVARGFGKHTVAEFVGDERCLNLLRSYGVNYAQGYFIGKPSAEVL